MNDIEQLKTEFDQLKASQALHRRQLEENRQIALQKRRYTKRLVTLGKAVEEFLPDSSSLTEIEIRNILAQRLK